MKKHITIGMDVSDKKVDLCVINERGKVLDERQVANTKRALERYFSKQPAAVIALEAGTHSMWQGELIESLGHKVLTGNPRRLRAIWTHERKSDARDAEMLGRIARFDPALLYPIRHRSARAHRDLEEIKARDQLVKCRRQLLTHVRGAVKVHGARIPSCSPASFPARAAEELPEELLGILRPLLESIQQLTERIRQYERRIETLKIEYPEVERLCAIPGVGTLSALGFVLRLEDPHRFRNSRQVGAYLGLVPRRDQSGMQEKQLSISKSGDALVRRLLVNCAQYILGPFGPDCELRRFGLRLIQRGGPKAKNRAVVSVARKLAVLMHTLWTGDEPYNPLYQQQHQKQKAA